MGIMSAHLQKLGGQGVYELINKHLIDFYFFFNCWGWGWWCMFLKSFEESESSSHSS